MVVLCEDWLETHAEAWTKATVHPFLSQCADATIQPEQFNTWLVQDYHFVAEFTRLVGRCLVSAPVEHFDVLLAGLSALKAELLWFRDKAQERSLDLDGTPLQPTCEEYCAFMAGLGKRPYAVQATALWAIELAYNQAWQQPGAMQSPYDEFADRWGNPDFTSYVSELARQANAAVAEASPLEAEAERTFLEVARLEEAFWQMAYNTLPLIPPPTLPTQTLPTLSEPPIDSAT